MRKNHYTVLGITTSATTEEVKVAFRRRAMELHPDQSGLESGPFLEVQEAYAILGDPVQRQRYDDETFGSPLQRESQSSPVDRPGRAEPLHSIGRVGGFPKSLFADFLARFPEGPERLRPSGPHPEDLTIEVAISRQRAQFGGMMRISLPIRTTCPGCRGRGRAGSHVCWHCGGNGALFGEIPLVFNLPGGVQDYAQIRVPLESYGIPNYSANILLRVRGGGCSWF